MRRSILSMLLAFDKVRPAKGETVFLFEDKYGDLFIWHLFTVETFLVYHA